jgi:ribosomal protein S18 acetylase RimI-like enzyme
VIRLGKSKDVDAIRELAELAIVAGIPATRDATPEQVRAFCAANYEHLDDMLKQDRNFVILVEEDQGDVTGYLMLDFGHVEASTGEKQCFIVDLAVRPDKRGRFATHRLINKASQLAAARGLKYLVGMVSSSNDRTLMLGQKAFGFEVERVQLVRRTS